MDRQKTRRIAPRKCPNASLLPFILISTGQTTPSHPRPSCPRVLIGLFLIIEHALTGKPERVGLVYPESREQIHPSLMPASKAAMGGRVWEKRQKEEEKRAGSRPPPSVAMATLQGDAWKRDLFCFISTFWRIIQTLSPGNEAVSFNSGFGGRGLRRYLGTGQVWDAL